MKISKEISLHSSKFSLDYDKLILNSNKNCIEKNLLLENSSDNSLEETLNEISFHFTFRFLIFERIYLDCK